MKSNNPFCLKKRAVRLYERLEKDFASKSEEILHSLPQFLRMGLIESKETWGKIVNKYDLLVMVSTSKDLLNLANIDGNFSVSKSIRSERLDVQFLEENDFRSSKIIKTRTHEFSVQDFVLSVGYHGTFHLKANKRPELEDLYSEFILKQPEKSMQLAFEIAEVLLNGFKEIISKLSGNNDAYCDINSIQPRIVESGALIKFTDGVPASKFDNSFLQLPVRSQKSRGIRICTEIELVSPVEVGYIFAYGNRRSKKLVSLTYTPKALVLSTIFENRKTSLVIKDVSQLQNGRHKVEVCLYTNGEMLIAINEKTEAFLDARGRFELFDGKLMIGSDLSGKKNGRFLNSCLSIEAINPQGKLFNVFRAGSRIINSNEGIILLSSSTKRRCLR